MEKSREQYPKSVRNRDNVRLPVRGFRNSQYLALLVVIAVLFSAFYLRSLSRWWFEDDPAQFQYVRELSNPVSFFTEPQLMRGFGTGNAVVPFQMLSYWFDMHALGPFPAPAYLHSLLSLLVTLVLLYFTLLRWTGDAHAAWGGSLLWLLLPSTLAVHYFLGARHYIEGLAFALLAVLFIDRLGHSNYGWGKTAVVLLCAAVSGAISMLFKEVYGAAVPAYFLLTAIHRKRLVQGAIAAGLAFGYFVYRVWMVGTSVSYTMPFLDPVRYLGFLLLAPFTISANYAAYILVGCSIAFTVTLIKRDRNESSSLLLWAGLTATSLIAIYPVSYAIFVSYRTPLTSYRIPFVVNTIWIVWAVYAAARLRRLTTALIVFGLIVVPGTERTRRYWDQRMSRAESEAVFYLENPDKLVYCEEDATWFLPGVNRFYAVARSHFINKHERTGDNARSMIGSFATIWRYHEGRFVPDPQLFREIQQENSLVR
jgi:hypothetical protein